MGSRIHRERVLSKCLFQMLSSGEFANDLGGGVDCYAENCQNLLSKNRPFGFVAAFNHKTSVAV